MLVEPTTFTVVQFDPPTLTVAPVTKFVPVIVMLVPPEPDPLTGLTVVTVGDGGAVAV